MCSLIPEFITWQLLVQIGPAHGVPVADLTALWNRAYSGYFVPLAYTEERMSRHLEAGSIALEHSVIFTESGTPVALSLLGIRGGRGWIGGFGVVPECRRRGIASRLIEAQVQVADALALHSVQLEVLVQNPARRVYERAGFAVTRRLSVFEGGVDAATPDADVREAPVGAVLRDLARLPRDHAPCWQREPESLAAIPREALRAFVAGPPDENGAAFLCEPSGAGSLRIHDIAGPEGLVAPMIAHAMVVLAATTVLLVNEPASSPVSRALARAGCPEVQAQWEMVRPSRRDS